MVLNRKFLLRAIVVTAAIFHAIRVRRGQSLPLSVLSYLGHLSTQSFLGVLAGDLIGLVILSSLWRTLRRMSLKSFSTHKNEISDWLYGLGRMIPFVESKIQAEMDKQERGIKKSLIPEGVEYLHSLPKEGLSEEEILKIMETMSAKEIAKWQSGRVSGGVYSGEDDHVRIMNAASNLYSVSNPLHLDLWPSLQKFESDICRMTASLLNGGDPNVVGAMTSGGTESIILAVRAHKLYAEAKRGITNPEIIACVTAHAAVEKACEMFGIHLIHVPCDPKTFEIDVRAVSRAISGDTIMVYSSAPNYATGIIDPIRKLSDLLLPQGIGLHVDCCLGGFVLPFARKLGYPIPDFDFTCPGVTSISADTHKFGYASKGSSVVLYRNKELRRYQYFAYPKWTGGLYATSTVAGSRAGSIVAATWASLVHIGENGYLDATRQILETRSKMAAGIQQIPDLHVLGNPQAMIVAFGSSRLNVYAVNDAMTRKGWALNAHQNPPAVHICVAIRQIGREEEFLSDLKAAVEEVRNAPKKAGGEKDSGSAPIYGSVSSLPPGPVKDVLFRYLDVTYSS